MYEIRKDTNVLITEPFCDFTEEFEDLLMDWYGDDLSIFNIDDDDLCHIVGRLANLLRFWCTDCDVPISSYEKLRRKYEALITIHNRLLEAYSNLLDDNEQLAKACRYGKRKIISTKIKDGCGSVKERRYPKSDTSSAA